MGSQPLLHELIMSMSTISVTAVGLEGGREEGGTHPKVPWEVHPKGLEGGREGLGGNSLGCIRGTSLEGGKLIWHGRECGRHFKFKPESE